MMDEHTRKGQAEADLNEDARLLILQILADEKTSTLTDYLIGKRMQARWGVPRPPAWLQTQLLMLETLGAITILSTEAGMIARLTKAGQLHVERIQPIKDVRWPPLEV